MIRKQNIALLLKLESDINDIFESIYKIFKTKYSFFVKQNPRGKVTFLFFKKFFKSFGIKNEH